MAHSPEPKPSSPVDEQLHCPQCGYNLTGIASRRCPECGVRFDRRALMIDPRILGRPLPWPLVPVCIVLPAPLSWLVFIFLFSFGVENFIAIAAFAILPIALLALAARAMARRAYQACLLLPEKKFDPQSRSRFVRIGMVLILLYWLAATGFLVSSIFSSFEGFGC